MLPANDSDYLADRFRSHQVTSEGGMTCVICPAFDLPEGFDREQSDLLIRLSGGYPDVPPDMWWFDPPVSRADGQTIPATDSREQYLGRTWQRWSRHLTEGQWRSSVDGIESFFALLRKELERSAGKTP